METFNSVTLPVAPKQRATTDAAERGTTAGCDAPCISGGLYNPDFWSIDVLLCSQKGSKGAQRDTQRAEVELWLPSEFIFDFFTAPIFF